MNKSIKWLLGAALATVLVTGCSSSGNYVDGTYEGSGQGNEGAIKVSLQVKDGKISKIDVVEQSETQTMMDAAIENTIPEIIEKQTAEGVDALSGATRSSQGVIDGVKAALEGAKK